MNELYECKYLNHSYHSIRSICYKNKVLILCKFHDETCNSKKITFAKI